MHTFCPFGACPGDSPWSPFCPWNIITNIFFVILLEIVDMKSVLLCTTYFTRCRWFCFLHLDCQRAMSSYYLLVSLAVVFTQTCRPFIPSSDSVYTKPARSDGEWSHTFFSLFGQWESPVSAFWVSLQERPTYLGNNFRVVHEDKDYVQEYVEQRLQHWV